MRPLIRHLAVPCLLAVACTTLPEEYGFATERFEQITRAVSSGLPPPSLPEDAGLEAYERFAEHHSPALRAADRRWKAALERVPQVGALPDPRLQIGVFLDEVETRTGPMEWRLGLSQAFPWFGTLDLSEQRALQQAAAAGEAWQAERLDLAQRVRDTWFEYAYVEAAVAVTSGHRDLLTSWEEIARTRYATGLGGEADVIRAQVELGKLDDRLRTLQDLRRPVVARLNAALNRPSATPVPPPALRSAPAPSLDEEGLLAGLPDSSPRLRTLARRTEAARIAIDLAGKEFYPDFSLGLEYTAVGSARAPGVSGSGEDVLAIVPGFSLPIRRRSYRAGVEQARAELGAASASLEEAHNRLQAELEFGLYRVRDAQRRIGLFRDTLVPKGQESVQSVTVAYQAGAADFLDLVDAERVLLEFQLAAARAQADHDQALAVVERLTGVPVFTEGP